MKELKKEFIGRAEVRGFKFTQIHHAKLAFLYEVDTGDSKHYEVFKRVINRRFACVSYPNANAFGYWAWTFNKLEPAIDKFNQLNGLELLLKRINDSTLLTKKEEDYSLAS